MSPEDVMRLARYNRWQNESMGDVLASLSPQALAEDRGAFFGSILATINHLLWADRMWMSRLTDVQRPEANLAQSVGLTPGLDAWDQERRALDARIEDWAGSLGSGALEGSLRWWSGATGREQECPVALCVTHMFNHQSHHRGQVHAMATAAGARGWVSDLFLMPQEAGGG